MIIVVFVIVSVCVIVGVLALNEVTDGNDGNDISKTDAKDTVDVVATYGNDMFEIDNIIANSGRIKLEFDTAYDIGAKVDDLDSDKLFSCEGNDCCMIRINIIVIYKVKISIFYYYINVFKHLIFAY